MVNQPIEQDFQFVEAEGFRNVVIGSVLHRMHGGLHGAISGDHHDQRIGPARLDLVQRLQTSNPRQAQVE